VGRFDAHGFVAYYLATLLVRQMAGVWVVWEMVREIKEGALSLRLLRPLHPLAAYSAESLAALPMRLVISLPIAVVMLVLSARRELTHDPVVTVCFVLSIAGAWLFNFCVSAMAGTLSFFIDSSLQARGLWLGGYM